MNTNLLGGVRLSALVAAACALTAASSFASTGEVTLSGSTWTGKVDGVTKYSGTSMSSALNACNSNMSSGTINVRNSGSSSGFSLGSNRYVNGNGVTITATGSGTASSLLHCANSSNVGASNFTMAKGSTYPWFGLYFQSSSTQNFSSVNGTGGGIAYRIDNCKGAWGAGFHVNTSINVSNTGSHGVETMGIQGSSFGTITSNDHGDGCGVLIQSYNNTQANTGTTVMATRACYGCGYAGFRTANTNRNQTLTYDDATSCGRGYFSVSNSRDCTITRVNATSCSDGGVWIQSAANTHVSGGTIQYCGYCSSITSSLSAGNNTVTVTCR